MVANENVVLEALAGNLAVPLDIASGQRREGPGRVRREDAKMRRSVGRKMLRCEVRLVGWTCEDAKVGRGDRRAKTGRDRRWKAFETGEFKGKGT